MAKSFTEAVKARRSIYAIGKEAVVSNERVEEIVAEALKHVPSPFNCQSGRLVLLLGAQHDALWDVVREALRPLVPAAGWEATNTKVASFQGGYGTVLYFEDMAVVEGLQAAFPLYADNFPTWSQHSSAMIQFAVWTSLEAEGLGASLQHYGALIENTVKTKWDLPASWKLIAQMPFGAPLAEPGPKDFSPLEGRLKVLK